MDDAVIVWDGVIESYDEDIKTVKSCTKIFLFTILDIWQSKNT